MTAPLVEMRGLTVCYAGAADAALAEVDLEVWQGERLAIVGESGSGKSTLALALAGLLPAGAVVSGTIGWPGLDHPPAAGRDIGFVFQDPGSSLNPVLRAFPHQLSGGQRQRIAIAEAIAGRPVLLIADEVTSALDTIVQAEMVALLDELVREQRMTLLFITHDIALASQFADRIAVFRSGRLVEAGPVRIVLQSPASAYTAELLASHIDLSRPPLVAGGAA
jgi:peptide/nickel transport system ATP-binding protein